MSKFLLACHRSRCYSENMNGTPGTYPALTKKQLERREKMDARMHLHRVLQDVERIAIMQVGRSASGMSREYRVIVSWLDGSFCCPTGAVANACGFRTRDAGGSIRIVLRGCNFSGEDEIAEAIGAVLGRKISYDAL